MEGVAEDCREHVDDGFARRPAQLDGLVVVLGDGSCCECEYLH
jgi:hypothetical protein